MLGSYDTARHSAAEEAAEALVKLLLAWRTRGGSVTVADIVVGPA